MAPTQAKPVRLHLDVSLAFAEPRRNVPSAVQDAPQIDFGRSSHVVIYHGKGRWRVPTNLRELFTRWTPGDYRVISRGSGGTARDDLAQAILTLEQDRSVEGTLAALESLRRVAGETGDEYDRVMAGCIWEMLVSRNRITEEQLREARTMAQVATAYERSLEEFGRKWFRRGRDEGRDEGIRMGRDRSAVSSAMLECTTAEEFLTRVREVASG